MLELLLLGMAFNYSIALVVLLALYAGGDATCCSLASIRQQQNIQVLNQQGGPYDSIGIAFIGPTIPPKQIIRCGCRVGR
jgi:hypothetical protein